MPIEEAEALILLLDESRRAMLAVLEQVSPETVVHEDSGWRVQDLIGHVTYWEIVVVEGLRACLAGKEYLMSGLPDLNAINEREAQQRRAWTFQQIRDESERVRQEFKTLLWAFPPEKLVEPFRYPWGQMGSVPALVKNMAEHEDEHRLEIERLLR